MTSPLTLLYLSRADVEAVALPMAEIVAAVEQAFVEKAAGRTEMPPKHWIAPSDSRFFSAMSSAMPGIGAAACKWQSGSHENHRLGLPTITGLLVLNDLATGLPVAIMDSTWPTAQRTAAASAVAARHLARREPAVLAILGCGVQARTHLLALRQVLPTIATVRAYDIVPENLRRYAGEMTARHGVRVAECATPREAIAGADIVVTAGPITPKGPRLVEAGWLDPGGTLITLDYDCYLAPGALAAFDRVITDDIGQVLHQQPYGYFADAPASMTELAAIVAGQAPGRAGADQRIVSINMGIALEDVATAVRILAAARERGIGTALPL